MAVRTWVWVVIIACTSLAVGCLALVGTGVYVAVKNVKMEKATAASTADRFEDVLSRLPSRTPLLSVEADGRVVRLPPEPGVEASRSPRPVDGLYFLIWEPDDQQVVEFRLPFWVFRMTGSLSLGSDTRFDVARLKLTAEEVSRRGPGLILDYQDPEGERVLMWAE
jgi:hypothetical protein